MYAIVWAPERGLCTVQPPDWTLQNQRGRPFDRVHRMWLLGEWNLVNVNEHELA